MANPESYLGWALAGVASVVSGLTGAVAYLYRSQIADFKAAEVDLKAQISLLGKRADVCESDRELLRIKLAVIEARLESLEATRFVNEHDDGHGESAKPGGPRE
jgi:hypothetical protein